MFSILSLIAAVQINIIGGMDGLHYYDDNISLFSRWSFGNIGFQEQICVKVPIDRAHTIPLGFPC